MKKKHDRFFSFFSRRIHFSLAHLLRLSLQVLLLYYLILLFFSSMIRDNPIKLSYQYLILCYRWDWWASGLFDGYIITGDGIRVPQNGCHKEGKCNLTEFKCLLSLSSAQSTKLLVTTQQSIQERRNAFVEVQNRWNNAESILNKRFSENCKNSRKSLPYWLSLNNDTTNSWNLLKIFCCVQNTKVDINSPITTTLGSTLSFNETKLYVVVLCISKSLVLLTAILD